MRTIRIWREPGDVGLWTSPDGSRRVYMGPDDFPMTCDRGDVVLVRVCHGATRPLFGGEEHRRYVMVSTDGPYDQIGEIDLVKGRWTGKSEDGEAEVVADGSSEAERDEVVRYLVNRWAGPRALTAE